MSYEDEIKKLVVQSQSYRRVLTKKSFYWFFVTYFPHYMSCPSAPFHKEMFNLLENPKTLRIAITAFRGSAKSTIVTLAYVIWSMIGTPEKKYILLISQTQELAKQILTNVKTELSENELLIRDFGPFTEVADEWRQNSIVISQYGCRISAISPNESVRGLRHRQYRPDLIIVDDVENLESVKTKEGRDKLWSWLTGEVLPLGYRDTKIVLVGNLLHEDSLMMRVKEQILLGKMSGVYREYPLLNDKNEILWKGMYPDMKAIEEKRKSISDESAWYREYLLKIISDEGRVVQKNWIKYYDPNILFKEKHTIRLVAVGVDLAISEKNNADYTSIVSACVVGFGENLKIYILPNVVNKRMSFPETIAKIKKVGEQLRIEYNREPFIYVENVAYQLAVVQQLTVERMLAEAVNVSGLDKRSRLSITTPYIKAGKVLFPQQGAEGLISQITNFGIEKHDDQADAFTTFMMKVIEGDSPSSEPSSEARKPDRPVYIQSHDGPINVSEPMFNMGMKF